MKKGIKRSVMLRLLSILLALLALAACFYVSLLRVYRENKEMLHAQEMHVTAIDGKRAHYEWAENLVSAIGIDSNFTGALDDTSCALGKWLHNPENVNNPKIQDLIQKILPAHQTVHDTAKKIFSDDVSYEQQRSIYLNETKPAIANLVSLLDELVAITNTEVNIAKDNMENTMMISFIALIVLTIFALTCYANVMRYTTAHIVNPILEIEQGCKRLQQGELGFEMDINTQDEIGTLADSLNDSIAELNKYVTEIGNVLKQFAAGDFTAQCEVAFRGDFIKIKEFFDEMQNSLSTAFHKIDESANVVMNVSTQVSENTQNMAQAASTQSSTVTQLSDRIVSVLDMVKLGADNAAQVSVSAALVGNDMQKSTYKMADLVDAMAEMNKSSEEISKIIKTIEDIAFQTNILALNAAVEAARAGTAGKGFAVVADEVRNLASKTAEASHNTNILISRSIETVTKSNTMVQELVEFINQTEQNAQQAVSAIDVVSQNAQMQVEELQQLQNGVENISQIVQSSAGATEENASASEELAGMAHDLKTMMGKFRVR